MNKIKVEKIQTGYAISFPFELKDNFKSVFKTAKWNSFDKRWEVGVRSKSKLDQWIKAVEESNILESLENIDSATLEIDKYETLKKELEIIKQVIDEKCKVIKKSGEIEEKLKKILVELEANRAKFNEIQAQALEAYNKKAAIKNDIIKFLEGIVDFDKVKDAQLCMINAIYYGKKRDFNNAQEIISSEYKKLKSAGYISKGLRDLVIANYNRPDRDHPKDVSYDNILDIFKIEEDDM